MMVNLSARSARSARSRPHSRRRLWPGGHRRQHARRRHPEDAGPRRWPAAEFHGDSRCLDRRRPVHTPRRGLPGGARDHAARCRRVLRLCAPRLWRHRGLRRRVDRLDLLLRGARLCVDCDRRIRSAAGAVAWRVRKGDRHTDTRGAGGVAARRPARQQPLPGDHDGGQVRRIPSRRRRRDCRSGPTPIPPPSRRRRRRSAG